MEKLLTNRLYLYISHPALAQRAADFNLKNKEAFAWTEPQRQEGYYTKLGMKKYLKDSLKDSKNLSEFRFWLVEKGKEEIIGTVCLSAVSFGNMQSCFLSYKIDSDYQNLGYCTEAANEAINFAFNTLKLHRIEASVMPHNLQSLKIMEKLNFEKEGYSKEYLMIAGKRQDHVRFALINKNSKN